MKRSRFLWLGILLMAITLTLTACPSGSPKGDLAVAVTPTDVAWTITGPDSYSETFTGNQTLKDLTPGTYNLGSGDSDYTGSAAATVEDGKEVATPLILTKKVVAPTTGTLSITANPDGALVTVNGPDGYSMLFKSNGASKSIPDLAPGTYTVAAEKVGFISANKTADVEAGKTVTTAITLAEVPKPNPVASITIDPKTGFWDEWDTPFATQVEKGTAKDVLLLAAQTEESVCFRVKVLDKDGEPVAGAAVNVNLTGYGHLTVVALRGCAINQTKPSTINTAAVADISGVSDANGEAIFTLFATYGEDPDSDYVPGDLYQRKSTEPSVKVVVSATNETDEAVSTAKVNTVLDEFKVWFYNIDHLRLWDNDKGEVRTPERWGNDLGERENQFIKGRKNIHYFETRIWRKQPNDGPYVPGAIDGVMRYTISGPDKDRVEFVDCDILISPLICDDSDGKLGIKPKASVTQESLPVEVEVNAVLTVRVQYGVEKYYRFPLKSYKFKKRWVGAFLKINKRIDHHVVTWKGPSHTLAQQGAYSDPWIATYTITVSNDSQQTAKNVTVTDAIQPELGYVTGSAVGGISTTYDNVLHQLTWVIGDLAPGDSKDVTFSVYARQKPGFCWDEGAYFYSARPAQTGSINNGQGMCDNPYSDPYNAVNGEYKDDVTAEADNIDPIDYDPGVDDVILYVVRPLFRLDKYIKLPNNAGHSNFITVLEDDNVDFGFNVTNVNRYSEPGYKLVQDKYTSYNNTAGDAVKDFGPDSDPASLKWANPYGSQVTLVDWFDEGLDYDNSVGGTWSPGNPKFVNFGSESLVKYKDSIFGDRALSVTASEPTVDRNNDDVIDGWINCAYMDAQNLNQPRHEHISGVAPFWHWWDAHGLQHPWHTPDNMHQITEIAAGDPPHTTKEPAAYSPNPAGNPNHPGFTGTSPTNVIGDLEDCVVVYVNPRADSKILTHSTIKEHAPASLAMTPAAFANANETDPVKPGDTYWYYFLVNAASTNSLNVDNIDYETTLTTLAGMTYTGNYRVMEAASNGGQWPTFAWADTGLTAVVASPTVTFATYNGLQPDHYLLYAVEVTAGAGPTHVIDADVLNSNADNQASITTVTEQTQVSP